LFRARVLARWAAALLVVGTVAAAALKFLPESFDRPFAVPTGVALIGLGVSLWRTRQASGSAAAPVPASPTGAEPPCFVSGALAQPHRTLRSELMTTSDAQIYQFRVAGHLDDHWSASFDNVTITWHDDGTSTLTGLVADQAQLHGILAGLRDIGATLLSQHTLGRLLAPLVEWSGSTPT
jgi:hypothetical protein